MQVGNNFSGVDLFPGKDLRPGVHHLEYVNWTAVPLSTIQVLLCSGTL